MTVLLSNRSLQRGFSAFGKAGVIWVASASLLFGIQSPDAPQEPGSAAPAPTAVPTVQQDGGNPAEPAPTEWVSLFNGVDLTGWSPKIRGYENGENFAGTFRVEDGVIKVGYQGYDQFGERFGHLFYREKFSHYLLKIEYRFVGEQVPGGPGWAVRNSGVMLHGQDPETMTRDQEFPVSIEVQFLGGDGKETRPTLNLCTPGTNVVMDGALYTPHCCNSTSPTIHGEEWVTALIEVRGNQRVRHILDGKVVLEYSQPQLDPRDKDAKALIVDDQLQLEAGTISLQSESHPVEFRKVEIRLIDPAAPLDDQALQAIGG